MSGDRHELIAAATAGQVSDPVRTVGNMSEDFRWGYIISLYCVYIAILWIGELVHAHWASSLGAALFLAGLYGKYWRFLFNLKPGLMLFCVVLCIVLPLIPVISFDEKMMGNAYQELIKYFALNFLILLGMSLPLTPLTRAKRAWVLYGMILAFLLSGWIVAPVRVAAAPVAYAVDERVKGFLVNGNSFALMAMVLLFLVDEKRSGRLIWTMNQVLVLFLVYLSHTSGALLAYLVGMIYRFLFGSSRFPVLARWATVSAGLVLAVTIFVSIPPHTFKAVDATTAKIKLAYNNIDLVLTAKPIDFYEFIQKNGEDVTSGLWRLYHWNLIIQKFSDFPVENILFGYGIGTMESVFYLKAHNDYLRFLFQTGLVGLLLNLIVWGTLYRRMDVSYRWVVIMIAFFCISENNYDNFPAMSMLALYMVGASRKTGEKLPNPVPAYYDNGLTHAAAAPAVQR